jgi:hypothetical protein
MPSLHRATPIMKENTYPGPLSVQGTGSSSFAIIIGPLNKLLTYQYQSIIKMKVDHY